MLALLTGALKRREELAVEVNHAQQGGSNFRVQAEFAFADAGEDTFAGMVDCLDLLQSDGSAGSLQGMNGAEDSGNQLFGVGIFFKFHEVTVKLVEQLAAFD